MQGTRSFLCSLFLLLVSLAEAAPLQGSCQGFAFPLQPDHKTVDTIFVLRVLRQGATVFRDAHSALVSLQLSFGEPLEPLTVSEAADRGRLQIRRSNETEPLGWMNREDLLCKNRPLRNEKALERKAFIIQPATAYATPQGQDCVHDYKKLPRFGLYFVFAEDADSQRYLLAEQYHLNESTILIGWVDVDTMMPWNTSFGLRPRDEQGVLLRIAPTLEEAAEHKGAVILGGQEWYRYPMHIPVLSSLEYQGKKYFHLVVPWRSAYTVATPPLSEPPDQRVFLGYSPATAAWVPELWIRASDLDHWLIFLKQLVEFLDQVGARLSEHRAQFAALLGEKAQQLMGTPPVQEVGETLAHYVQRQGTLPIPSFSPLLQYELHEIRTMESCELRRLSHWIRSTRAILSQIRADGTLRPVFVKGAYPAEQCPSVSIKGKNVPRIELRTPTKLGPDDSYRYDHMFRGEIRYWLPEEFLP